MTNAKQKLLALVIGLFISTGAFAQKGGGRGEDKRPIKNPDTKVVVKEKEKPQPSNNQGNKGNQGGKRGRP